jgi:hypothetical protein
MTAPGLVVSYLANTLGTNSLTLRMQVSHCWLQDLRESSATTSTCSLDVCRRGYSCSCICSATSSSSRLNLLTAEPIAHPHPHRFSGLLVASTRSHGRGLSRERGSEEGALGAVADSRWQRPSRGRREGRERRLLVTWGVAPDQMGVLWLSRGWLEAVVAVASSVSQSRINSGSGLMCRYDVWCLVPDVYGALFSPSRLRQPLASMGSPRGCIQKWLLSSASIVYR